MSDQLKVFTKMYLRLLILIEV